MPGKLSFVSDKIRSISDPQLDVKILKSTSNYEPVETVEEMSEAEYKSNWFKTWPERHYDKLDQSSEPSPEEESDPSNEKTENEKSPVPLIKILDNIPLAYSPVTKQLHFLNPNDNKNETFQGSKCQLKAGESTDQSDDEFDQFRTKSPEANEDGCKLDDNCKSPGLMLDLSQNLGKDLVLRSCLKRLELSPEEKFNFLWNSKIGYSDPKRTESVKSDGGCALRTEASSFSSIVSSLSDSSPSNVDETSSSKLAFLENDDLSVRSHCSHDSGSNCGESSKFFEDRAQGGEKCDGKKKGFSGFFSRNVFSWKGASSSSPTQGWKLFGRNASQESNLSDNESSNLSGGEVTRGSQRSLTDSPLSTKKYEDVVASSSALILHNRPANLPAKSVDEEQKHRMEYQQIVEAAKRKELKETKLRKKQLQQQLKVEEQLANASRIWNNEILPKWEMMKNSRKARELWWAGIPPCVRGKVWKLAIGNELNITNQLYEICLARAQERLKAGETNGSEENCDKADKESSVELIQLDISRTFPHLCIFQKGGPYYDILHCLLGAYVCYRPDLGYVQGMSFIAAILILNLEAPDAFMSFSNLLNRPCHMAFFSLNQPMVVMIVKIIAKKYRVFDTECFEPFLSCYGKMQAYYDTYNDFFRENLPRLHQHFEESSLSPDLYLLDWVYSVFAKAMPLDVACRVWDVYLRDGEEFLFRTALGILHLYKDKLIKLDFIYAAQFLTKLPEDLSGDLLFKSIDAIKMNVGKQKYNQVLGCNTEKYS